ncbi:MAG: hypothetical protein ACRD0S_02505 [Acidimicrobiales bacterium]
MRTRPMWRAMVIAALAAAALGACGDDDDDETSSATNTTATTAAEEGENELSVEMVDYGYKIEGTLKAGLTTITSTNAGKEWHMMGVGKLKAGATVEQLATALQNASPDSEADPAAEFIEAEIGTPGHILQPGATQSLTVDTLAPGNYAMLCFLPTEGEGTPHFAKGMIGGFEVAAGESGAEAPTEDVALTLGDEAEPAGAPTELDSGEQTIKLTSSGSKGKDFIVGQLKEGKAFEDFDTYFESQFEKEGGPAKGAAANAPGKILGSTFEVGPGKTIWLTVDVPEGETYLVSTTNSEGEDGDEETVDKFVKVTAT